MTSASSRTSFDSSGKNWGDRIIRPTDRDLPGLKFNFLKNAIDKNTRRVLEVGCSGGRHLGSLQTVESDRRYVGCDIDVHSAKTGKEAHPEIDFIAGDGLQLPFQDETFDAVYFMDYLEHVEGPDIAVSEIVRTLKKGGVLSAYIPCEGNRWTMYRAFSWVFGFNVKKPAAGHVQSFSDKQVIALLSQQHLEVTKVRYSYHLFGHSGDFLLFLFVFLSKKVAKMWWSGNKYYHNESKRPKSFAVRIFNLLLSTANFIAYLESRIFHRVRFFSAGIHVNCTKL